ncbi:MAG TPA: glycosyltransferase family 2 protein, partial [Nitrospirota bacterium]|nr:glycosyltransferase family 2 protein [Nitrospirota bacterium]
AETLGVCIGRAKKLLVDNKVDGEILVSDNGSTDGSQEIARALGARVVECPLRGYGAALQCGIEQADSQFILIGDSDDSYHFDEAWPMIEMLKKGYDVCMGTRLKGKIMQNAMPALNRYLGNPVLSAIGKVLFKSDLSDFHCGMRAFRKDKLLMLNLATTGMEWASEMVVKAKLAGLKMTEVPVTLYKDGRSRSPHLRRWRDGWRHLRFMLLHSPTWLFTIPGLVMTAVGVFGQMLLYRGMVQIGTVKLDVHTMLVMSFLSVVGAQVVFTGTFVRLYSSLHGILPYDQKFEKSIKRFTLEKLLIAALVLGLLGLGGFLYTLWGWYQLGFSELNYEVTMRRLIPSLTLMALAIQGIFNGFMLSILFLKTNK